MFKKRIGTIAIAFAFFFIIPLFTYPDEELRRYIPIIELNYPDNIVKLLLSIKEGVNISKPEDAEKINKLIEIRANDYLWINGFIVEDRKGNKVILTQGDLIKEVNSVTLLIVADKKIYTFSHVPIIYTDINSQIAVIPLPPKMEKYVKGFRLDATKYKTHTPITIAGYSHDGIKPVWKVFNGTLITRGDYEVKLPEVGFFLIHDITEDLKEEGRPILVKNKSDPPKYTVIGMSFFQEDRGMLMAEAFPMSTILELFEKYNKSIEIQNDPKLLEEELKQNIKWLEYAVKSDISEDEKFRILSYLISYNCAFNEGYKIVLSKLKDTDIDIANKVLAGFLLAPTTEIKFLLIEQISNELKYRNTRRTFNFEKLNMKEDEVLTVDSKVDSIFKLTQRNFKITWIFEQGTWKIGNFYFTPEEKYSEYKKEYSELKNKYRRRLTRVKEPFIIKKAVKTPEPVEKVEIIKKKKKRKKDDFKSKLSVGLLSSIGYGSQYVYEYSGDIYINNPSYILNWSAGVMADYTISQEILLSYGLKYTRKGSTYETDVDPALYGTDSIEIEELLNYWEIPLILRTNSSMNIGIGIGLNFLSIKKGDYVNRMDGKIYKLDKSYYDSITKFNISFILVLAKWFNLGKRIILGLEAGIDSHLGSDWSRNGEKSRYYNFYAGTSIKYRIPILGGR